ncbi:MAG: FKBP-type peptidyl-prolyl cis-trans isomerase [Bacteroidetes bacterium]|nr:FKBP-type peptidyl-prolyl cis-trans isomerase [Bacteroidota bacterium]
MVKTFSTYLFLFLFVALITSSCRKEDDNHQLHNDIALIEQYLADHQIEASRLESGLFYFVHNQGSEQRPNLNSTLTVSYTGKLLDGSTFDTGSFVSFPLSNLIKGWQQGLPLIGSGGRISLFIPSPLGYGSQAKPGIPANSVLIFDINLHYFSN